MLSSEPAGMAVGLIEIQLRPEHDHLSLSSLQPVERRHPGRIDARAERGIGRAVGH
jgi:hypothetical protein